MGYHHQAERRGGEWRIRPWPVEERNPILKREGREADLMNSRTANCVPSRLLFEEKGFATVARLAKQEARRGVSEEKNHQKIEFNQANKRREVFKQVGEPA